MNISGSVTIRHDDSYVLPIHLGRGIGSKTGEVRLDCPPLPTAQLEPFLALVETAVGIIAATRLGLRVNDMTSIVPDHPLPSNAAVELEQMANLFVRSRSLVAGSPMTSRVVLGGARNDAHFTARDGDHRRAVIAWSGGIDSTTCVVAAQAEGLQLHPLYFSYYSENFTRHLFANERNAGERLAMLLGKGVHPPERRDCDLSPVLKLTPHLTYRDDIDIDGWELFGRNLLICLLMWAEALTLGAQHIIIGLTAEDLFCTEERDGHTFYSECCQSIEFIRMFNSLAEKVGGINAPTCAVPLLRMRKGAVIRSLCAAHRQLLFATHCCINDCSGEDGTCFSCYDKFWGIIAIGRCVATLRI